MTELAYTAGVSGRWSYPRRHGPSSTSRRWLRVRSAARRTTRRHTPRGLDALPHRHHGRLRAGTAAQSHELAVRVDEKVGHNSQGFLPIVAPHFGGIWQDVQLLIVPTRWIDDRQLLAVGDPATGAIHLEVPLRGQSASVRRLARRSLPTTGHPGMVAGLHRPFRIFPSRSARGRYRPQAAANEDNPVERYRADVPVAHWQWWSLQTPHLYEVELVLGERARQGTFGAARSRHDPRRISDHARGRHSAGAERKAGECARRAELGLCAALGDAEQRTTLTSAPSWSWPVHSDST